MPRGWIPEGMPSGLPQRHWTGVGFHLGLLVHRVSLQSGEGGQGGPQGIGRIPWSVPGYAGADTGSRCRLRPPQQGQAVVTRRAVSEGIARPPSFPNPA